MHTLIRTLTGVAATAALSAALVVGTVEPARAQTQGAQPAAGQPAQPTRNCKDTAECDLINNIIKDLSGQDQAKFLADLNAWTQKYPESDWKDERPVWYMQAYALNPPQPDKVVEYGSQVLSKGLKVSTDEDKVRALRVLAFTSQSTPAIKNPTPEQLATGDKASKQLLEFLANPSSKPSAINDQQWAAIRADTEPKAKQTLLYIATYPGDQLMAKAKTETGDQQKADYAAAEQAYRTAYQANPDMGMLAYDLGSAIVSQKKPETYSVGLFYIARAVALDPAKGGLDEKSRGPIDNYLKNAYTNFHGTDEGLAELKQQAAASPNPPADFKIKTTQEIALEKQKEFEEKNPELARWMGIKAALSAPDGETFFASNMKDAQIPTLKGQVMGGKPECNPKELSVAIPLPDQKGTVVPEITLKLETALKGKPVAGQEISFTAVPSAFTKEPFMLTMDVDKEHMPEVKVDPCTPAKSAPKGPAKGTGGATKKGTGTPATKKK